MLHPHKRHPAPQVIELSAVVHDPQAARHEGQLAARSIMVLRCHRADNFALGTAMFAMTSASRPLADAIVLCVAVHHSQCPYSEMFAQVAACWLSA